ncbi:MAG: gamma-glutamylcyclotransferase family protein [Promethearchaeota archaeon]
MLSHLISIVGYGTFITHYHWKGKRNVEVCLVKDYIRIFPQGNWFPYVLPCKGSSFWALKFDVNESQLKDLDFYEGVTSGLFKKTEIEIILKNNDKRKAFIYIPTEKTIQSQKLTSNLDKKDRWKEEIKKNPDIVKKFPELII